MPKRITNSYYPQFEAVDTNKMDNETYEMTTDGDNTSTDYSSIELPTTSEDTSPMSSPQKPKDHDASSPHSPTENTTSYSESNPDEDGDSLNVSATQSQREPNEQVSWSDSDGSTYVSEEDQMHDNDDLQDVPPPPPRSVELLLPKLKGGTATSSLGFDGDSTTHKSNRSTEYETFEEVDLYHQTPPSANSRPKKVETRSDPKPPKPLTPGQTKPKMVTLVEETTGFLRTRGHPNQMILQNVDYYCDVEVASTNDGLSATGFLSEEATRGVFCRRLIPLEISATPKPKKVGPAADDVSAISSVQAGSVMPTGDAMSTQAAHTRRGTTRPKKSRASVRIHEPTKQTEDEISETGRCFRLVIEVPNHYRRDSLSSLESSSSIDDSFAEGDIYGDDGSDDAVRRGAEENTKRHHKVPAMDSIAIDDEPKGEHRQGRSDRDASAKQSLNSYIPGTEEQEEPTPLHSNKKQVHNTAILPKLSLIEQKQESPTDRRIRELKEKIHKMQVDSTMEALPEQDSRVQRTTHATTSVAKTDDNQSQQLNSAKMGKDQASKPTKQSACRPAHARARTDDLQNRLQLQDVDYLENVLDALPDDNDVLSTGNLKISKASARTAFHSQKLQEGGSSSSVPSEVTTSVGRNEECDDVSTIHCDMALQQQTELEEIDLETGSRKDQYGCKQGVPMSHPDYEKSKAEIVWNKTRREVIHYTRKASKATVTAAQKTNDYLEQYPIYGKLRVIMVGLWMKYMNGRTRTEQSIIVVILMSFFILFILLVSIIAKK